MDDGAPMGLIAGQGRLPVLVAEGMRTAGRRVCCVGFRGQYDPSLPQRCDAFRDVAMLRPSSWTRFLRRHGAAEAIMVGRVAKTRMHDPLRIFRELPDLRAIRLWYRRLRHDKRSAAVLMAIAEDLERCGVRLIDSTTFIPEHIAAAGVLGSVTPPGAQWDDVVFGWPLLARLQELDIGQALAARERDVIAVEAVEGTDSMIDRAGSLCPKHGWVLLKSASPAHDMRADVPTIGVATIERLAKAGAGCIAVGAGRTILLDKPQVIEAADRAGIAIVGVPDDGPAATPDGG